MKIEKFCPILDEEITEDSKHPESCDYEDCKFNIGTNKKKPVRICILFQTYLNSKSSKSALQKIQSSMG
ncbi:hypothetical protein [Desulfovibrio sp. UCD-KL4C]|uniref:hypothetical protein n=1 Tax=Desulfovibrio sp. UCD-KL4C TaxID=2578120 RepID=UPI0025BC87AB|nr:hypothetical protein [Desulfovibrio sp. UCD-KL4C]